MMKRFLEMPLVLKITVIFFLLVPAWGMVVAVVTTMNLPPVPGQDRYYQYGFRAGFFTSRMIQNALLMIVSLAIWMRKRWVMKYAMVAFLLAVVFEGYSFAQGFANGAGIGMGAGVLVFSYALVALWYGMWLYFILRKKSREYLDGPAVSSEDAAGEQGAQP